MEELKRCPFCGGMAHIKYDPDEVEEGSEKVWVYTVECGACAASSGLCYSKEQAIEVWNRRDVRDAIMREPTAEPERKTGKWMLFENQRQEDIDNGNYMYTCSNCLRSDIHAKTVKVPYCWFCGAKMED